MIPIPKYPHIYLDSGVVLSIQAGAGYCSSLGSYEVMPMRIDRCPYGWHQYHQHDGPWTESSVFCYVPAKHIAAYIEKEGICTPEAELLPLPIQRELLMRDGILKDLLTL